MFETSEQPLKIAISAMGGQGGGVLSDWIQAIAETCGYIAQSTSVPGVAQRTGATIYYLELFPAGEAQKAGKAPVLGLTPIPGDVDILIAAELAEAGRAVQRGFITPDRTTVITTSHRSYTINERSAMGNGLADSEKILSAVQQAAKNCIAFDMEKLAQQNGSVISSVLLGALAGTQALPFGRDVYEAAIRQSGVAVTTNLAAFAASYQRAENGLLELAETGDEQAFTVPETAPTAAGRKLLQRIKDSFPESCQGIICEGVRQLADYQDWRYAELYLNRLVAIFAHDSHQQHYALTTATARYLALWMAFQDTIRVADQKTRKNRSQRIRQEVKAQPGQLVYPVEFLHPRLEEVCDCLPRRLGDYIMNSNGCKKLLSPLLRRGRLLQTGKLRGFLLLYLLSGLRLIRRSTRRYAIENAAIERWLQRARSVADTHYALAVEIIKTQRLIKGYSDTHARGLARFNAIMALVDKHQANISAQTIAALSEAALAGEDGKAFADVLERVRPAPVRAA